MDGDFERFIGKDDELQQFDNNMSNHFLDMKISKKKIMVYKIPVEHIPSNGHCYENLKTLDRF